MVKITIFGLAGTGTSSIGKQLAKDNNLEFISTGNIFRELAKNEGYTLIEFSELCKNNLKYDKELDNKIKTIGKNKNNFVIDSRLAWYFIPDSIKIKLNCEFNTRIKRISKRDNLSIEETKIKTNNREKFELERYSKLYNLNNYFKDENFELIIDTTNKNIEEIIKIIQNYIKNKY